MLNIYDCVHTHQCCSDPECAIDRAVLERVPRSGRLARDVYFTTVPISMSLA